MEEEQATMKKGNNKEKEEEEPVCGQPKIFCPKLIVFLRQCQGTS